MTLQEEFEQQGNWLFKYRGTIPLIPLSIGLLLYLRTKINGDIFFLEKPRYEIYYEFLCLLITLFGLAIRVFTVGHSPKNTSGRNTKEQVAGSLNTTGLYSIVRHPLYLGNFFMWIGPALLTGNFWFVIAFCFFYWIYYERIMFAEEQFLRRKFGNIYTGWAENVPAFIPKFKGYIDSDSPMIWKKILQNEKTGLLVVFIVFSVFDIAGKLIQHKANFNYFFIIFSILSLLFYLIIKYLEKRTDILKDAA